MGLPTSLRETPEWVLYRLRRRSPRVMAVLEREVPLRPIASLYSSRPDKGWRIPSTIYQTWATDRLGRSHRKALEAFRERNADFSFELFDDARIAAYMAASWGHHPIHRVFEAAQFGPIRTDIWRYCILFERGGGYVDISKAIGKPIREMMTPETTAIVSWEGKPTAHVAGAEAMRVLQHPRDTTINWGLFFAPGHPILRRAIDGIVANYQAYAGKVFPHPKEAILDFTGPHFLTGCLIDAAEAGELAGVHQASINFHDTATWYLPGSWVRYATRAPYEIQRDRIIVS